MAYDYFYIFNKKTFVRTLLGEVQSGFNMSFVIDGTKDSCSIIVYNFDEMEVEPNTIAWHEKTNTWWIISHDKVERYQNENGFLYEHNLELLGAIELLNVRDLTDCGFNDNTYTIREFINRLFSLSTFEYDLNVFYAPTNFLDKKVEFIKTFENYTLLTALREFLDAYNMSVKLTFNQTLSDENYYINDLDLHIIPKTGDTSLTIIDIDTFDNVRETKSINKESFGTTVVSNAENITSSYAKTFPLVGTEKLSSTTKDIDYQNAIVRLPSKVFKGNWIKFTFPILLEITLSNGQVGTTYFFPYDESSYYSCMDTFAGFANLYFGGDSEFANAFYNEMISNTVRNSLIPTLSSIGSVTLYEGNKIIPTFNNNSTAIKIEKGDNVPYLAVMSYKQGQPRIPYIFTDKDTKNMLEHPEQGIAWERGSDLITGFECLKEILPTGGHSVNTNYTDYQGVVGTLYTFNYNNKWAKISVRTVDNDLDIIARHLRVIVNYIPMTDLKIKVDNDTDTNDMQLYNQNGRLTDGVALSKVVSSYSQEITSDTISRYAQYYSFNAVPQVGTIVNKNGVSYVINNVSMTFIQNESNTADNFAYFIDCQFTMAKYVSTKSMLVNPNTNVRDYGIPQNYNVKRKQLYRDLFELNYAYNNVYVRPYLQDNKVFTFSHFPTGFLDFSAIIKIKYNQAIGGDSEQGIDPSDTWYYQLDAVRFNFCKSAYCVVDFKDNNIIGYSSQNVFSGFDPQRIISGLTDTLNTPISYVDDDGKLKDIGLLLCNKDQLQSVYTSYIISVPNNDNWSSSQFITVFIPEDIFNRASLSAYHEIEINEINYNKDALEVPVFEYCCQIKDNKDVLIGDNILLQYSEDYIYFYSFATGSNLTQNTAKASNFIFNNILVNAATIRYAIIGIDDTLPYNHLRIKLYLTQTYDSATNTFSNGVQRTIPTNTDLAIFRHAYNKVTGEEIVDLMFIAKNVTSDKLYNSTTLCLAINCKKDN